VQCDLHWLEPAFLLSFFLGATLAGSTRRPDRPTTLSRPLQLPTCCNFRRQPWTKYVHGEFSYTAAPRCYAGFEDELGTAAENEVVVSIIESLQATDKQPSCSRRTADDRNVQVPACNNSTENHCGQNAGGDSNGPGSHSARKSSQEIADIQISTSLSVQDMKCNGGFHENLRESASSVTQEVGKTVASSSKDSSAREMRQDINQNLRLIHGDRCAADVGPETKSRRRTGSRNSRHRSESPATGKETKSKSRRSRHRSSASRDKRQTNSGAERNQNGDRKLTCRSRTLSPALNERFDCHISRPVQTDTCKQETARYDVIISGRDSPSTRFRFGVPRKSRKAASASECTVGNGSVKSSSTSNHQRSKLVFKSCFFPVTATCLIRKFSYLQRLITIFYDFVRFS